MRVEVVAIGTELLLGQIQDTNSTWISEQLATIGVDCYFQTKVGDNLDRIALAIRSSLARADGVILCGGLGPTQDDITREAIAMVVGVELEMDQSMADQIAAYFANRERAMPKNNLRQAERPPGSTFIAQRKGTAPGLICPVGNKVIYAVPGVPYEMKDMVQRAVLPDIVKRSGQTKFIGSRVLRTWGLSESGLAEAVAGRLEELERTKVATIAFLASGVEGIKLRITAKGETQASVETVLGVEEAALREILGDTVFGTDEETMESVVGEQLKVKGLTLAVAESLTGGLIASRVVAVPGASDYFKGGVVSYATAVKREILGVEEDLVVTEAAAIAMAKGVAKALGASVGLSTTGVAGPDEVEGQPVGTVWIGVYVCADQEISFARLVRLPPGDRAVVRSLAAISAMDVLRRALSS